MTQLSLQCCVFIYIFIYNSHDSESAFTLAFVLDIRAIGLISDLYKLVINLIYSSIGKICAVCKLHGLRVCISSTFISNIVGESQQCQVVCFLFDFIKSTQLNF